MIKGGKLLQTGAEQDVVVVISGPGHENLSS